MMTDLTLLDVCAGIGSFSLGAHRCGIKTIAQIELEENRRQVLAKHFPDVIRLEDIRDVTANDIPGQPTIIAGGTPCQNLSVAGNRAGLAGEKSQIWYEYLRLVKSLTPEWVVWENVPGALSSNGGQDFLEILRGLDECGYHVAWRVLDARYYGVPQRRERVFVVGHLRDGRAAEVLFESESVPGNSKTRPERQKGLAITSVNRPGKTKRVVFRKQRSDSFKQDDISSTLTKRDHKDYGDLVLSFSPSWVKRGFGSKPGMRRVYGTLLAGKGRGYSDTTEVVMAFKGQASVAQGLSISDTLSPALVKNQINTVYQDNYVRRLTEIECERLQGFPDDYTAGHSMTQRYAMLGDSIAVPVSEWIMRRIVAHAA